MADYHGKLIMDGVSQGPILDRMETGDELRLIHSFGKVTRLYIEEAYTYQQRRVYVTDKMGILYGDELVPTHRNFLKTDEGNW
ncbi:hypothetical protein [Marininema halotolerans]|uniref:Uncharacterized protein n=1 Tax=Marininema halotolerans TaxID=1155944 RepID=A0A1I6RYM5_9BACL|nr:hypothetical protein [Marininema halotolerans]SFS69792.1 hypothetical protein SAMN05444972_10635 [Marininema halotolerans]